MTAWSRTVAAAEPSPGSAAVTAYQNSNQREAIEL